MSDFKPAVPTAERVERFYALLCRFGADALLDTALGLGPKVLDPTSPMAAADATAAPDADPSVSIDMGRLFREAAKQGGIAELAAIVLDCSEVDAPNAPVAAIRGCAGPFRRGVAGAHRRSDDLRRQLGLTGPGRRVRRVNPLRQSLRPLALSLAEYGAVASATEAMRLPLADMLEWAVRVENRLHSRKS